MKRIIISMILLLVIIVNASDLFTIYDPTYLWGGKNNSVASIIMNPSFSGLMQKDLNVRLSHFTGLFSGADVMGGMISAKFDKMSLFIDIANYSNPEFDVYNEYGDFKQTYSVPGNAKINLGFTYQIMDRLFAGIQYTYLSNTLVSSNEYDDIISGSDSLSFISAGINYELAGFLMGLSFKNIKIAESSDIESVYPDLSSIILSVSKGFLSDSLHAGLQFGNINKRNSSMNLALSLEYNIKFIFLRAAYLYQSEHLSMPLMAGLGIKFNDIILDYTFCPGEVNSQHYVSIGYGYSLSDPGERPKREKRIRPKKEVVEKKEVEPTPIAPSERILVAVMDFEAKNMGAEEAVIITDFVRHEMINSPMFRVLERGVINQILNEVNFQQTGCTDAECAVQIGKILAVNKMVVGSVSKLGRTYFITSRLVNVETSEIEASVSIEAAVPIDELPRHVKRLVNEMMKRVKK